MANSTSTTKLRKKKTKNVLLSITLETKKEPHIFIVMDLVFVLISKQKHIINKWRKENRGKFQLNPN